VVSGVLNRYPMTVLAHPRDFPAGFASLAVRLWPSAIGPPCIYAAPALGMNARICRRECIEPDGGLAAKVLRDSRAADRRNVRT
jgi:hypothetical protein